jgi:hypothetical protein
MHQSILSTVKRNIIKHRRREESEQRAARLCFSSWRYYMLIKQYHVGIIEEMIKRNLVNPRKVSDRSFF